MCINNDCSKKLPLVETLGRVVMENWFLAHLTPFREGLDEWVGWWTGLVLPKNLPLRDSVGFRPTSSLTLYGHLITDDFLKNTFHIGICEAIVDYNL